MSIAFVIPSLSMTTDRLPWVLPPSAAGAVTARAVPAGVDGLASQRVPSGVVPLSVALTPLIVTARTPPASITSTSTGTVAGAVGMNASSDGANKLTTGG